MQISKHSGQEYEPLTLKQVSVEVAKTLSLILDEASVKILLPDGEVNVVVAYIFSLSHAIFA